MFHPPDILSANDNAQEPSTQAEAEFALHSRVSTALAPCHSRSVISPSPERHLNPSVPFPPHTAYNELVRFHTPNHAQSPLTYPALLRPILPS
jgi:hypothetical protein